MTGERGDDRRLRCPLDALPLEREAGPTSGTAIHRCGRHEYPEVRSIPVLLDSPGALAALAALRRGDGATATGLLLAPDRWTRADSLARAADRLLGGRRFATGLRARRVARFGARHRGAAWATYRQALEALLLEPPRPEPESFHYFLNRPADPTFAVAEAVISAVPAEGEVLDACCGAGHLTRLLLRGREGRVTGLDESFPLLFLASSYLAPGARLVCARADRPLPFAAGVFRTVVCSDALHDTAEPALLAREILRVTSPGGTALAIHLHNSRFDHAYPGRNPLTPEGYASIFESGDPRLLDEGPILSRWIERGEVDLSASRPPAHLARARTVALLAGDRALDRPHRPAAPDAASLALNPMYDATPDAGGLRLARSWPSPFWAREYPDAASYLPEEAFLGREELDALRGGRLAGAAPALARRRVLLDLPPDYGVERPW